MKSSTSLSTPPPSPHPHPAPLPTALSSSLTSCPELDLSVSLSPAPGHRRLPTRGLPGKKRCSQVGFKETLVTAKPKPQPTLASQRPIGGQRRNQGGHSGRVQRQGLEPPATASSDHPGYLDGATLNSTLALKAELQALEDQEFDSQKVVEETLQKSERTKNLMNTRATEGVNVARSRVLFSSLVSVDVEEDGVTGRAPQGRLPPAPHNLHDKATDGPSLLFFMTPDLLRQKPFSPEEEPVCSRPRPLPRPSSSTFDLYRRQRRWEAAP